jgi:hypothetical protein
MAKVSFEAYLVGLDSTSPFVVKTPVVQDTGGVGSNGDGSTDFILDLRTLKNLHFLLRM